MRTRLIGSVLAVLVTVIPVRFAHGQQRLFPSPASSFSWLRESSTSQSPESSTEKKEIETDRDSFTPATTTADRNRLIFESAYTFLDQRRIKETHSFPEILMRYGLTDRIELRLGWNYEVGGAGNDTSGSDAGAEEFDTGRGLERATSLSYGAKVALTTHEGLIPRSAVIVQGSTPTSGKDNDTQFVTTFVAGWDLPQGFQLDTALRYASTSEKEDHFNIWAPSVVVKFPVLERFKVHAEYFSLMSANKTDAFTRHYFSPGLHYLVTDDLEIGFRVGWGLNDQSVRFFSNVGLGYRF